MSSEKTKIWLVEMFECTPIMTTMEITAVSNLPDAEEIATRWANDWVERLNIANGPAQKDGKEWWAWCDVITPSKFQYGYADYLVKQYEVIDSLDETSFIVEIKEVEVSK
jgi:hypothetical protein